MRLLQIARSHTRAVSTLTKEQNTRAPVTYFKTVYIKAVVVLTMLRRMPH